MNGSFDSLKCICVLEKNVLLNSRYDTTRFVYNLLLIKYKNKTIKYNKEASSVPFKSAFI